MTRWDRVKAWEADGKGLREALEKDLAALQIGKLIATARKQAGLTQTALAALSGMPGSKISSLENKPQNVELATLLRIARAAGCRLHIRMDR